MLPQWNVSPISLLTCVLNTVVPGYNDLGLYDSSSTALDNLYCQLIPYCSP